MIISKTFKLECAHRLPKVPEGHKCARLHGHSIFVEVSIEGPVGEDGMVCDFAELSKAWVIVHDSLDHRYLNEVVGLENPTSENIARWIWGVLSKFDFGRGFLTMVEVRETCTSSVKYAGPGWTVIAESRT